MKGEEIVQEDGLTGGSMSGQMRSRASVRVVVEFQLAEDEEAVSTRWGSSVGGVRTRQGLQRVPGGVGMAVGMEIGCMSKYFKDERRHVFNSKRNGLQMWKWKFKSTSWDWIGIGGIYMNS